MTGPSVVTMSSDAFGRAPFNLRTSSSQSSLASAWTDANMEVRVVLALRRVAEDPLELAQRLRAASYALQRRHLAVVEREDRLHGEELPGQAGRLADPPAADEVLEGVHGEEETTFAAEALDERVDLVVVGAAVESALDRVGEDHRAPGGDPRVDDAHLAPEVLRRQLGARKRAGKLLGESDAEDPLVAGELFERGGEVGRRGLRALGRLVALPQEAVELGGRDVDVLAPRLSVAEAHVERDDAPARATVALRQVGRRVEDDRRRVSR